MAAEVGPYPMTPPSVPAAEDRRLDALRQLGVLDTAPEPLFQALARLASEVCGTDIALVNLVDARRQWFKANIGLSEVSELPREQSFCDSTIAGHALFEVGDATGDPRYAGNGLVTGARHIRYYAGVPLTIEGGLRVGTLCVMDSRPHQLSAEQKQALLSLAELTTLALTMRRPQAAAPTASLDRPATVLTEAESHYQALVEEQSELISVAHLDGTLVYVNRAYASHFGMTPSQMTGVSLYEFVEAADRQGVQRLIAQLAQTGETARSDNRMRDAAGAERWVAWTNHVRTGGHGQRMLHSIGRDVTARRQLEEQVIASERFLRQLTDSLPLRIAYLDRHRRYRFANRELLNHLGLAREDVIGRTRAELRPQDNDRVLALRAQEALSGNAQQFEFTERVDGELRRFENRLVPDLGPDGQARGFFVTGIDITQRSAAESGLRELTAIFDNTTDFIVQTDRRGQITYLNPSARAALGIAPDEAVAARNVREFITDETNRKFAQVILPAVKRDNLWLGRSTVIRAGGHVSPVSLMVLAHRNESGRIERCSGILRDIAAEEAASQEIARQTETLHLVAEAIPATVAVVNSDGRYRMVNTAFERAHGRPRAEIIGRKASDVLGEAEFARRLPWVQRALSGQEATFELDQGRPGGWRYTQITYVPLRLGSGEIDGFVAVSQDITRQKQEEVRLKDLAQRDGLTGLWNRAGFEEILQGMQSTGLSLSVLYIDLDLFKPVNDTYGHPVGDEVLRLFGQRLRQLVRPTDCVARLGGDEFAVALSGLPDVQYAAVLAGRVLKAASTAFEIGLLLVNVSASVGVAFAAPGGIDSREVVARADEKLLKAKAAGRGRLFGDTV